MVFLESLVSSVLLGRKVNRRQGKVRTASVCVTGWDAVTDSVTVAVVGVGCDESATGSCVVASVKELLIGLFSVNKSVCSARPSTKRASTNASGSSLTTSKPAPTHNWREIFSRSTMGTVLRMMLRLSRKSACATSLKPFR